jgi:uncharacterized membrane protein YedE/YeeE
MLKARRLRTKLLLMGGTVFGLGLGLAGGCGAAMLQRLLVALAFD